MTTRLVKYLRQGLFCVIGTSFLFVSHPVIAAQVSHSDASVTVRASRTVPATAGQVSAQQTRLPQTSETPTASLVPVMLGLVSGSSLLLWSVRRRSRLTTTH